MHHPHHPNEQSPARSDRTADAEARSLGRDAGWQRRRGISLSLHHSVVVQPTRPHTVYLASASPARSQ